MQYSITFPTIFMSLILTVSSNTNQDSLIGNVTFLLYTRLNPNSSTEIIPNNDTTIGNYNPINDNKILIHGYNNNRNKQWLHTMKDAFLQKEDVNVILVDWGPFAVGPLYPKAVSYTKVVGEYVAILITYLITLGSTFSHQHIIGHSLGAQIAGFAGTSLGGQMAHITGLDPAGPMFEDNDIDGKLDKTDALFVDVLHTNAGNLAQGSTGVINPAGHIDFYPNGGTRQPGCEDATINILGIAVKMPGVCSHSRGPLFYSESILNADAFISYPCSNYTSYSAGHCTSCGPAGCHNMGYGSKPGQTAMYYLATRSTQPYSGKPIFVVLNISPNQTSIRGQIFLTLDSQFGSDKQEVQMEGGNHIIDPGMIFNSVIAVYSNLNNFYGGRISFVLYGKEAPRLLIIDTIQVWDPQTNQRICVLTNTIVPSGGNDTLLFTDC